MDISTLAEQINASANAYRVGELQEFRAKLHGKTARTKKLFTASTIFPDEEYAYHDGGRTELQFNIGIETRNGTRWLRHGVAFSFESGQSLPDPSVLYP